MKKITDAEIHVLLEKVNLFRRHKTWTNEKRDMWQEIQNFVDPYIEARFSGTHHTYGISQMGEVCTYDPVPQSGVYRAGIRQRCLILCTGHTGRAERSYVAIAV